MRKTGRAGVAQWQSSGFVNHRLEVQFLSPAPVNRISVRNHATAGNQVITLAQQTGLTVVERARLQQIFQEQQIRLTHTADDDADILRVGKLVGADRVIFVAVHWSQVISGRTKPIEMRMQIVSKTESKLI